jgi:prepilin peptidase CpaA
LFHSALAVFAVGLFLCAAASDVRSRRIPNALTAALAVAGLARILLALAAGVPPLGLATDLMVAAAVFAAGAVMFHLALLGGGDVKLLAAGSIWVGAPAAAQFLIVTVLAGGLLAALFAVRLMVERLRCGTSGRPTLPYGVAIAAGGIAATAAVF